MVFVRQKWVLIAALVTGAFAPARVAAQESAAAGIGESALRGPVGREMLVRMAIARSPALSASRHRARALRAEGDAEGSLPAPELMFEIWQVPVARPLALGDAQMIEVGIKQKFPAPGSLSRKREVFAQRAEVVQADAVAVERSIAREVSHAFADYLEAVGRRRIHAEHHSTAERMRGLAEARQATGGGLTDLAAGEMELARAHADLAADEARIENARARLNGLLVRDVEAPLGEPIDEGATTLGEPAVGLSQRANSRRPELSAARAERAAELAEGAAAEKEAAWPEFSVGALYFAPTDVMPEHGYGVSLSASLPWLWGGARDRREATRQRVLASEHELSDVRRSIAVEVASAAGSVKSETARFRAFDERVLPAVERARESALSGFEAGRTDLSAVLEAERMMVEARMEHLAARSALDHALVELEWSMGAAVRRAPIGMRQTPAIPRSPEKSP